jgi:hypothetical protein
MKQILLGFLLGVVVCLSIGAEIYHPLKGIIIRPETSFRPDIAADFKAVMMNQETIFNLVNAKCGDKN